MSGNESGDPETNEPTDGAADLVKFFRALRPATRLEYDALAKKDGEFGEDVTSERRAAGGTVSGA